MSQQRLDFPIGHGPVFQVKPDTIKAKMGCVVDIGGNEVPQGTHANRFLRS
jgi:hypothetical protein